MKNGLLFNVQKYSVQDGPGIRTTFFLKGCPLSCRWCHNPEGIAPKPEIVILESRCISCGACLEVCPYRPDSSVAGFRFTDRRLLCQVCGACAEACPTRARQVAGSRYSAEEILRIALLDRVFYDNSAGGVTFSGGEPLMQPEFTIEALRLCKEAGIRTAVDTCGLVAWKVLEKAAAVTDLFLYDLKSWDAELHRRYTGVSNEQILTNLRALSSIHKNIWVRIPVIPGFNATPAEMHHLATFAETLPGVRKVTLLPFHDMGREKWNRVGRERVFNVSGQTGEEQLLELQTVFTDHGLKAQIGG